MTGCDVHQGANTCRTW